MNLKTLIQSISHALINQFVQISGLVQPRKNAHPFLNYIILLCSLIVIVGGGCASGPKYNPFKVSKDEIRGQVKTVALSPLATPAGLVDPEPVRTEYNALIEAKLKEGGFSVIPANEWAGIWAAEMRQAGGFFDPVTGKRDEAKYSAIRAHALQDLRDKLHADAILFPSIGYTSVRFSQNSAKWHGTSESLLPSFWSGLENTFNGTVPAYTLQTALEDNNGRILFVNYGGIQLKEKLNGAPGMWGRLLPVPRSKLFIDPKRNQGAVDTALNPLVKQP